MKLIIIRGNSGSGKSSLALSLRQKLSENGVKAALVSQDYFRRTILKEKDRIGNSDIVTILNLNIRALVDLGYSVILEGILSSRKYGPMLLRLNEDFGPDNVRFYYYDVSLEETLKRHKTKPNSGEFGKKEMLEWWLDDDKLGLSNEIVLAEELSLNEAVRLVLS